MTSNGLAYILTGTAVVQGNLVIRLGSRWSCGWLRWRQGRLAASPSWASAASLTSECMQPTLTRRSSCSHIHISSVSPCLYPQDGLSSVSDECVDAAPVCGSSCAMLCSPMTALTSCSSGCLFPSSSDSRESTGKAGVLGYHCCEREVLSHDLKA